MELEDERQRIAEAIVRSRVDAAAAELRIEEANTNTYGTTTCVGWTVRDVRGLCTAVIIYDGYASWPT